MRSTRRLGPLARSGCLALLLAACALLIPGPVGQAAAQSLEDVISSVVRIKTDINPDGQTVAGLGRKREGSGVVIDADGLVLTIGYLMVEAYAAEILTNDGRTVPANIVGYDHESGFGLLRAADPLKLKPMPLGKSGQVKERDMVVVAAGGGRSMAGAVEVVSKREFAGNWEYMLDEAIFTSPPHPNWSGAALVNREGQLVGVGSLIVGDASGGTEKKPGNMFVPIDRLPPILSNLLADGRIAGPGRPWIGVNTDEVRGRLIISRVSPGGPAEKAGLQTGDIIVGVNGERPQSLVELYRKIWAVGPAGAAIPLDVLQQSAVKRIDIRSINRLDHLRLRTTF
jgi:serine protease Do